MFEQYIIYIAVSAIALIAIALFCFCIKKNQNKNKDELLVNENIRQLMENLQGGIVTCLVLPIEKALKITYISDGWTKLTEYSFEDMQSAFNLNPQMLIIEEDRQAVLEKYSQQISESCNTYNLQYRIKTKSGEIKWVLDHGVVEKNRNNELENQSVLTDITVIKQREYELSYKAQIEPSTGLYNKPTVMQLVTEYMEASHILCALMLIDIDDFKTINDTFGHTFGDMVLIDIATRLKNIFTHNEILARIGGDEFLVFLPDIKSEAEAEQAASDICCALRIIYNENSNSYRLSCSIGVTCAKSINYHLMFEQADKAMYDAKQIGKDQYALYKDNKNYAYTNDQQIAELDVSTKAIDKMIFDLLYSTTDFIGSVNMALSFLCNSFNLNYAYIFEITENKLIANNTFEWIPNSETTVKPSIRALNIEKNPTYFDSFLNNNYFYSNNFATLDEYSQQLFKEKNVKSILQLPLIQGKTINGLFGFGRAANSEPLSDSVLTTLVYATKILSIFIAKQRAEDKIFKDSKNKAHAMDNLPVYVYVIDVNRSMLFYNKLISSAIPDVKIGDKCYKHFMNRSSICENCPAEKCGDGIASCKMINTIGMPLISTAQSIEWDGKPAFMITCQDLGETS